MKETPQSRRLRLVLKESKKSIRGFAEICDVSHTSIARMCKGEQDINFSVIRAICIDLGYSSEWFLLGTGDKKRKGNEAKLVTEIQMLRAELDISQKLNMKLQARMTGIELEYELLKKQVEQLSIK